MHKTHKITPRSACLSAIMLFWVYFRWSVLTSFIVLFWPAKNTFPIFFHTFIYCNFLVQTRIGHEGLPQGSAVRVGHKGRPWGWATRLGCYYSHVLKGFVMTKRLKPFRENNEVPQSKILYFLLRWAIISAKMTGSTCRRTEINTKCCQRPRQIVKS